MYRAGIRVKVLDFVAHANQLAAAFVFPLLKAKINSEGNYDVAVLAAQARALDVDELLRRLGGDAARPHLSAPAG